MDGLSNCHFHGGDGLAFNAGGPIATRPYGQARSVGIAACPGPNIDGDGDPRRRCDIPELSRYCSWPATEL